MAAPLWWIAGLAWWKAGFVVARAEGKRMVEQDMVGMLMRVLGCSERHARSIYIFHIDRPGPASLFQDRAEESFEEPPDVPPLIQERWSMPGMPGKG